MRDLDERLHGIDRLSPPDLLWEARVKAESPSPKRPGAAMTSTRRLATIVVALVIGLGSLVVLVPAFNRNDQQVTPAAPVRERIVFSSVIFPNDPGQIYSMAPDGSDLVRLTQGTGSYSSVSISPDGTRLAYVRLDQAGGSGGGPHPEGIYVANSDGTNPAEVFRSTETPQSLVALQWSPDGQSLGFILRSIPSGGGSEADWGSQLWVMSAEGSDPHPVSDERITSFSWSPTGDRFAVTQESVAGDRFVDDIFVVGVDGSNVARLTSQGASRNPIWSPDGERIVFAEGWMPDGPRVMVMRADGSEVEPLPLQYEGWAEPLAWAPDSMRVLVGGGNDQHDCSMLLASASGETSLLLEGTTALATQHSEPGETPSATGDPCVQSASWTPTPGTSDTSPSEAFSRLDVYLPLLDDLAGDHGDTLFVKSDICRGAEDVTGGEEPPCDDRFTEAEQAEIAQAFPDWKQVRFFTRYEDIPKAEQPINHEGNVYVWSGPLEEHGNDEYWIGAGMSCGGLCGGGGTFVMRLEGGSWASYGHAPGTGVWIS